jgi:hypothetical protein
MPNQEPESKPESAEQPSALFAVAVPVITKIVDQFRLKSAKDWVDGNSQSGAFDCVGSCVEAEKLIRAIQEDVLAKVRARISACIKPGKLKGDGCDEQAQRNGLILAQYCLDEVASANDQVSNRGSEI